MLAKWYAYSVCSCRICTSRRMLLPGYPLEHYFVKTVIMFHMNTSYLGNKNWKNVTVDTMSGSTKRFSRIWLHIRSSFFFQEKGHCFNLLHHQFICIIESTPARVILILIWSRFSLVTSGVLLPKRTYYVCNWRICILIFLKFDTCCSIEINKLMRYTFTIHCSCD